MEARSLLRHRDRSALIVLLIAVPVATMIGCGSLFRLSRVAEAADGAPGSPDPGTVDPFVTMVVFLIGGLAFFEAAMVIYAALAVGMRRRQREIGLASATGAAPRDLQLAIVASAALLAGIGVVLGVAGGMGLTALVYPLLERWVDREPLPLGFTSVDLIGAALFGFGTAVLAAARPAGLAARLPVTVALSGRRPVATSRSRPGRLALAFGSLGVALLILGALSTHTSRVMVLLAGSAAMLVTLCLFGAWILAYGVSLAGPLPLVWRIAVRDAGRFRSRNAPVIAAITGAMSLCVMLLAVLTSAETFTREAAQGGSLEQVDGGPLLVLAVVISAGTSLIVVLVATALSSAESAADARTLEALGARPHLVRHLTAARAAYLAVLGSVLAIPGGLLPALSLIGDSSSPLRFEIPWLRLAGALSVLPIAAYLAMWLLSRSFVWTGSLRSQTS